MRSKKRKSSRQSLLGYILIPFCIYGGIRQQSPSFNNFKNSELDSRNAINYINALRKKYNKKEIVFEPRAFRLAVDRAKDMRKSNYYDHTNPHNGNCPDKIKSQYGFQPGEYLAENINGYENYSENIFTRIQMKPMTDAVDGWMNSRGHRYNLLYDQHAAGAVGCHKDKCVFLGLNNQKFGSGCYTAKEGKQHWNNVPMQSGEIEYHQQKLKTNPIDYQL
jgi:uncharacterized protein YkwD